MKEFHCKDIGEACKTVLKARTEERLVELAAIHLRDIHGMAMLSQEMTGRIKNLFIDRTTKDAARVVDRIFEKYNCSGEPECSWRFITEAETILKSGTPKHKPKLKAA
jgi:predicted small metal-binding protein